MNLPLMPFYMNLFIFAGLLVLSAAALTLYLVNYKLKTTAIRRQGTIFVFSIAGLLILYIIASAISGIIGRQQLKNIFADARSQKIPITPQELQYNYSNSSTTKQSNDYDNGAYFYTAAYNLAMAITTPDLPKLFSAYASCDLHRWEAADRQLACRLLAQPEFDQVFTLLRQSTDKPFIRFGDYDFSQGVSMLLPHLATQRNLYRLLQMKSIALALDGKPATAYQIINSGLRSVKLLEKEPFLISQLCNLADGVITIGAVNILLAHYGIDDQSGRQLMDSLDRLNPRQGMTCAMNSEIAMYNDFMYRLMTGYERDKDQHFTGCSSSSMMAITIWGSPLFYWDWLFCINTMLEYHNLFQAPYWQIADRLKNREQEKKNIPVYCFLSRMILPGLSHVLLKAAHAESEIAGARLSIALHLYKNRHGTLPEKLEQLAPEFIKTLPTDSINGKPFGYRREGSYFILSSVWLTEKQQRESKQRFNKKTTGTFFPPATTK